MTYSLYSGRYRSTCLYMLSFSYKIFSDSQKSFICWLLTWQVPHTLSPVFCCLPHDRTFFLGTAHGGNDLSPRLPALPALKWAHIVAFFVGTWGPGTKVSIPEQVLQNHILRPATPANTRAYFCARLLKMTFLIMKSLNSKETCKCVLC